MKSSPIELMTDAFTGDAARRSLNTVLVPRSLRLLQDNALLAASENRCRAMLAQSAINDTASIAMSVDRLSKVSPAGAPYYKDILAAYAEAATKTIERW